VQVAAALREQGLESSNLILGIDFTKSNEWTGKQSFGGQSLHRISDTTPNPYEQAISIIGKTLAPFDEDNLIPCFGFGDGELHAAHGGRRSRVAVLLFSSMNSLLACICSHHP